MNKRAKKKVIPFSRVYRIEPPTGNRQMGDTNWEKIEQETILHFPRFDASNSHGHKFNRISQPIWDWIESGFISLKWMFLALHGRIISTTGISQIN